MKEETKLWLDQAKEHLDDAIYLYDGSRFSLCVYSCHQALEKILKAAIVELKNTIPSKIHNLDALASETGLPFPEKWNEDLAEITRHFWNVRYPDFQKFTYTTKDKIEPTFIKTKEIFQWILTKLNQ